MKTKLFSCIVTCIVTLSLILPSCVVIAYADAETNAVTDISDMLSADAEFSNDKIIVVFDRKNSLELFDIDKALFSSIECSDIQELTTVSTQKIKNVKQMVTESVTTGENAVIREGEDYSYYRRMLCLELSNPGRSNVIEAINSINKMDGVLCAIPNFKLSLDNSLSETEALNELEQTPEEIYELLGLDDAWSAISAMPKSTVRVAVIDSGIDDDHTALAGKIDEDNSARLIKYSGEVGEYAQKGVLGIPTDDRGHGTHVAGIIGASYDAITGTRGVCSTVEFVSIKILDGDGNGDLADLVSAMEYVRWLDGTEKAVQVVNISAGIGDWYYQSDDQTELADAIFAFEGLVVCSAGNNNINLTEANRFPASLDGTNIITVGASTINDTRWSVGTGNGSNYDGSVDIFAPGVDIVSCVPNGSGELSCPDNCSSEAHISDGYHALTGTSMATPFVTGVAAILLSVNPNIEIDDLVEKITGINCIDYSTNSDDSIHELYHICESGGRLNASKAVNALFADAATCPHPTVTYTTTELYHTAYCASCAHLLYNSSHSWQYGSYDQSGHSAICTVCSYYTTQSHNLYVYSDNGESGSIIKCNQCDYTWYCFNGMAEYDYAGTNGHYVNCTCGCYAFLTPHKIIAIMQSSSTAHSLYCEDCSTLYYVAHSWVPLTYGYECAVCGMYSDSIPGTMQIPPDDELLIASNDDTAAEDALLSEKEEELVTE